MLCSVRTINMGGGRRMVRRLLPALAIATVILAVAGGAGSFPPARTHALEPDPAPGCAGRGAVLASSMPVRDPAAPPAPPVGAPAFAVVDAETGRLLYGVNENERRSPASTTKIMTAILAIETVSADSWTVSETDGSAMLGSSVMGLRPGQYIKMRDLLYGLMLPSGNDAAIEIAKNVDGTVKDFVGRMNAKAAELGMENTNFQNPHGLDRRQHYSTAFDLSLLGRYAMKNAQFREIVGAQYYQLEPPADYGLYNGNSLLAKYPGADGIKIGWTDRAGWTLVASAVRDGRRLIVTVLDSPDRDADAAALLDWAFASYRWETVNPRLTRLFSAFKRLGVEPQLARSLSVCA